MKLKIINGNSNTYIAEMREIVPPILAKRIRFVPYSKLKKTVCLRVELYGCSFQGKQFFSPKITIIDTEHILFSLFYRRYCILSNSTRR